MEKMMGHHESGAWIDITKIPPENLRLMEFDTVVYTERLSNREIQNMYPELYQQHFTTTKVTKK